MKKNNKGFMLAELVIVSAVVIGTMVALYTGFNKASINYKERSKYYSIDCLYAGQTIKNLLIDEFKLTDLLNNTENYIDINEYCKSVGESSAFNQYCQAVYKRYNIDKMYLVKYNKEEYHVRHDLMVEAIMRYIANV